MSRSIAEAGLVLLAASLLLLNSVLLLAPAQAGTCTAECGGGNECSCSGQQCTAKDNWGCSGGDMGFPSEVCRCGNSTQ